MAQNVNALRQLRSRVLDEDQSLAGLLRACLMLSAETHSEELRTWATKELNGYEAEDELPTYRRLGDPPLFIDTTSGPHSVTGQQIGRLQVPEFARDGLPDELLLHQPIEELERLAAQDDAVRLGYSAFADLAAMWTNQLGAFQSVDGVYYKVLPSTMAGIISRVRTMLVQLVADLADGLPLDDLPSRERVDSAVNVNVYGKGNRLNWNHGSPAALAANTQGPDGGEGWWTWPRRIGAALVGCAVIAGAAVQVTGSWPF